LGFNIEVIKVISPDGGEILHAGGTMSWRMNPIRNQRNFPVFFLTFCATMAEAARLGESENRKEVRSNG